MADAQVQTLAQRVRAKFPGAYDDMDDLTLEQKVLAKYPQYSDIPRTPPNAGLAPPAGGQFAGTAPRGQTSPQAAASMHEMTGAGTQAFTLPAHGAGSLGPGQPEATPGMRTAGAIGITTGIGAQIPGVLPWLARGLKPALSAIPTIAAMEGIRYARENIPGGKYIPPGAEWLPMFMGGKAEPEEVEQTVRPPRLKYSVKPEVQPTPRNVRPPALKYSVQSPEEPTPTNAPIPSLKYSVQSPSTEATTAEGIAGSLAKGRGRVVITPEEEAQRTQLYNMAKKAAHERGMAFAGGQVPSTGRKVPWVPRKNVTGEWRGTKEE